MNNYEYLRKLRCERDIIKKNLAFTQTEKKRDFLFKRLMKVTIEIERVKNENNNSNKPSNKEKS